MEKLIFCGENLHFLLVFICQHQRVAIAAVIIILEGDFPAGKCHLLAGLVHQVVDQAPDIVTVLDLLRSFVGKTISSPDGNINSRLRIFGPAGDI